MLRQRHHCLIFDWLLFGFRGFLRCDDLLQLRSYDIKIAEEMMKVKIPRSKTDQLRHGDEVLIARTSNSTFPVSMMERYIRMAGIDQHSVDLNL